MYPLAAYINEPLTAYLRLLTKPMMLFCWSVYTFRQFLHIFFKVNQYLCAIISEKHAQIDANPVLSVSSDSCGGGDKLPVINRL